MFTFYDNDWIRYLLSVYHFDEVQLCLLYQKGSLFLPPQELVFVFLQCRRNFLISSFCIEQHSIIWLHPPILYGRWNLKFRCDTTWFNVSFHIQKRINFDTIISCQHSAEFMSEIYFWRYRHSEQLLILPTLLSTDKTGLH